MSFDLLIVGGRVVDPAAGIDGPFDVAIHDGRIAAVEPSIRVAAATSVIQADGHVVTPGLIDLHTHAFTGVGPYGVDADAIASRTGVTTWVDAGSAGAYSLPGFHELVITPATVRILAFLNISYLGLGGLNYDEYANLEACDVALATRVAERHREIVVGVKARMGTGIVGYQGLEPLRRAIELAEVLRLPVMVHISTAPPAVEDVLALMRPGDVLTHAYTGLGERLADAGGVKVGAQRARDAGIVFDVGHGAGSFSFESAEALTGAGIWPDTISSDLHQMSLHGHNAVSTPTQASITDVLGDGSPAFTLLTVMTKFLHLGMPFSNVIAATTEHPARLLGLDDQIGTLRPGAIADVAILRLAEGAVTLHDVHGETRAADRMLEHVATIVAGRPMDPRPLPKPPPWIRLVDAEARA